MSPSYPPLRYDLSNNFIYQKKNDYDLLFLSPGFVLFVSCVSVFAFRVFWSLSLFFFFVSASVSAFLAFFLVSRPLSGSFGSPFFLGLQGVVFPVPFLSLCPCSWFLFPVTKKKYIYIYIYTASPQLGGTVQIPKVGTLASPGIRKGSQGWDTYLPWRL